MIRKENILCLDVECGATGKGHSDRTPISFSLVDSNEKELLFRIIKPREGAKIIDFLTPLTNISEKNYIGAVDFETAELELKNILKKYDPLPIIVGASVFGDIKWMNLQKNVDYLDYIDLTGDLFKAWNPKYQQFNNFSLAHLCEVLLPYSYRIGISHDPTQDAKSSIRLYNEYGKDKIKLEKAKNSMINTRSPFNFAKSKNWNYNGICLAGFYPEKCFCKQPTLKK